MASCMVYNYILTTSMVILCNSANNISNMVDKGIIITVRISMIKAIFSVHKLIPKNIQMTTLYTNWSYASLSPWFIFIILDKNDFVKVSHH